MAKRKRQNPAASEAVKEPEVKKKQKNATPEPSSSKASSKAEPIAAAATTPSSSAGTETLQIVTGSYDRVLHGLTATVRLGDGKSKKKQAKEKNVEFADTFLFNAHTSAIRCVAVSPASAPVPGQQQKIFLASGGTDERINLYDVSAHPPKQQKDEDPLSTLAPRPIVENRKNRELGTLLHHSSTVTALRFPTRSKLLSSGDDSTIAVTRTRDWSVLSSIKAPIPTVLGRPSGDTAAFGGTPSGVNDFAIHPSMKLMISVSKGERSMRLWNLMTGKKAGVLNFERDLLQEVGEPKHSTGEGRKVVWGSVDGADEFAVGFDRDIVVFGMDSEPKCRVMPTKTKVHHFTYLTLDEEEGKSILAVGTEDGRILFFSTAADHITAPAEDSKAKLGLARLVGQIGGKDNGVNSRIKEFAIVKSEVNPDSLYVMSGSSNGVVGVWTVSQEALKKASETPESAGKSIGRFLGSSETRNRITCLTAYLMIPRPDGVEESEDDFEDEEEEDDSDSDDDE